MLVFPKPLVAVRDILGAFLLHFLGMNEAVRWNPSRKGRETAALPDLVFPTGICASFFNRITYRSNFLHMHPFLQVAEPLGKILLQAPTISNTLLRACFGVRHHRAPILLSQLSKSSIAMVVSSDFEWSVDVIVVCATSCFHETVSLDVAIVFFVSCSLFFLAVMSMTSRPRAPP